MACATATTAFFVAAVARDAVIARGEGGVAGACGHAGGFDEAHAEPAIAGAGATGPVLARTLVVPGTQARPAGQVGGGREAGHVHPDLGEQDLGGAAPDAGDAIEPGQVRRE